MINFDRIAPYYDALAGLVFAGRINMAQFEFLNLIKPGQRILVIGGGSGAVLNELQRIDIPLKVDFVEVSAPMIEKAKKRVDHSSILNINFHQLNFEEFYSDKSFDWIHCGFFLDLFEENELVMVIDKIRSLMSKDANLLISDFRIDESHHRFWQLPLMRSMLIFFRIFAGLKSRQMKDIHEHLTKFGFVLDHQKLFFSRFIFSANYSLNKN